MNATNAYAPVIAVATTLLAASCTTLEPTATAAAANPKPPVRVEATADDGPNDDCWHYAIDDSELVAVWVSPRLPGQVDGGFRFVNLIYHDATARRPILLHARPVHSARGDAIAVSAGGLRFAVAPVAARTWSDVVTPDDLVVRLERP